MAEPSVTEPAADEPRPQRPSTSEASVDTTQPATATDLERPAAPAIQFYASIAVNGEPRGTFLVASYADGDFAVRHADLVAIGIDDPVGTRVTLEDDVWIKLVNQQAHIDIGAFSFLGRGTELDVSRSVSIGSNVLIAPRVFITDHSHNCAPGEPNSQQGCISQPVRIGNDVWIGTGATILSGVTIGDGAVIGAGAVVRSDVPTNEIWAGVPARKIRER